MKKLVVMAVVVLGLVIGFNTYTYASDWDAAGKVFAVIEGLRVVTGETWM